MQPPLPVLMYHGIHENASSSPHFNSIYSVSRAEFEQQLDAVLVAGLRTTTLAAGRYRAGSLMITFDDGDESNFTVAAPLLRQRNMVAEFFVSTRFIDGRGMLSGAQIGQLSDWGMGVNSHGHTHRYLSDLSYRELHDELTLSKDTLESITGKQVVGLALPGGLGGRRETAAARTAGYQQVLNSVPRTNRNLHPDRCLNRFAVRRGCPQDKFVGLITGRGHARRVELARHAVLAVPKQVLGNETYRTLRSLATSRSQR